LYSRSAAMPAEFVPWQQQHEGVGDAMRTGGIDSSQIQAMIAQLKAHATRPQATPPVVHTETPAAKVEFSSALKTALDNVNGSQVKADAIGKSFAMGDDAVSLSDVMISMQKASINFQATVQVRNKLVSAYHDIMNMQV
jgi:flagellar hook-basal body complex protein FliE